MNAEISFTKAILVSAVIHLLLIGPFYNSSLLRQYTKRDKPLVVDYCILKEVTKVISEKKITEVRVIETPRVEIKKETEIKKQSAAKPKEAKTAPRQAQPEAKRVEKAKNALQEAAKSEAKIKSTKDYVNYYNLIREKIRARLKDNYKNYYNEGEVYTVFTLSSDGELLANNIEVARSTADKTLLELASISLREAAPFPRFPKALTVPRMSFNVLISFKKK